MCTYVYLPHYLKPHNYALNRLFKPSLEAKASLHNHQTSTSASEYQKSSSSNDITEITCKISPRPSQYISALPYPVKIKQHVQHTYNLRKTEKTAKESCINSFQQHCNLYVDSYFVRNWNYSNAELDESTSKSPTGHIVKFANCPSI